MELSSFGAQHQAAQPLSADCIDAIIVMDYLILAFLHAGIVIVLENCWGAK
jgi:hypothetical protein